MFGFGNSDNMCYIATFTFFFYQTLFLFVVVSATRKIRSSFLCLLYAKPLVSSLYLFCLAPLLFGIFL